MSKKYKYPRTYHLPFSPGATSDDKILLNTDQFTGKEVVITEKLDGQNCSIYQTGFHARSIDSKHEDYHSWLLQWLSTFQWQIPEEMRICGEYLYAKHSIGYEDLPSYFLGFSIWDETTCLDWDMTMEYFKEFNIVPVPVLYQGIYDEKIVKEIANKTVQAGREGIVIRLSESFSYEDFSKTVAKYVRANHVQTDKHWKTQEIVKNKLK